jgi:septal ring factor EnvC (AmiA/AmiB activator)
VDPAEAAVESLGGIDHFLRETAAALTAKLVELDSTHLAQLAQRAEAEEFRRVKLEEMRTEDQSMVVRLQALQARRGELEHSLYQVRAGIAETEMRLTQTNEERSEFEDANSGVLYALEQAAADARCVDHMIL